MKRRSVIVAVLVGMSLYACHRQSSSDILADQPVASISGRQEDRFGDGFGKAFRGNPNSRPMAVKPGDVTPVSLTAEPVAID